MENLGEFVNKYLKVDAPTQEDIDKLQEIINEKKRNGQDAWSEEYSMRWKISRMGANRFCRETHADTNKNLARNIDKDCIVAYTKDRFMAIVIVRSTKKFFAFVMKASDISLGGMGYSLMDMDITSAYKKIEKFLEEYPEGTKIDKPQLWQQMKNTLLINAVDGS
jgi:hypothetical protein